MKSKALEIVTICGFFFSARKGGNYVRNQIFIKGTRKVFLLDVSKMRKARQLLQFIFLLCGNF